MAVSPTFSQPVSSATRTKPLSSRRAGKESGRSWVRLIMAVLATIGLIDTGSITAKRWGWIGSLSCPGGSDGCDKVLGSAWGTLLGQPLSLFGFLAYATVLLLALMPLLRGGLRAPGSEGNRWALFFTSSGMAVFSMVLMGLLVFEIRAFCTFCVVSAALSLALFLLSLVGGPWIDRSQLIFRGVMTVLLVGLLGLGWAASADQPFAQSGRAAPAVISASSPAKIALSEHLSSVGARVFTAYWCPHCHDQKEAFGKEAAAKLLVIECAEDGANSQAQLCKQQGVQGYPSWQIKGVVDSGVKPLNTLADLSGYTGPRDF
ncbi:thioredoxin [Cyanobium sp. A2C-AMD]|nr:thioredoxin [Cyanobium sp. A2C-AMD]